MTSLLPPASTDAERALEAATARIGDVDVPLRDLWNPDTCPAELLPWLGWGLSIDIWDGTWTVAQKRAAIAACIEAQRRKGTPLSVRSAVDRFDEAIQIVEWFNDRDTMDPHNFRLELPLAAETSVTYTDAMVEALVRDISAVKPLRAHMDIVHALSGLTHAWLLGSMRVAGFDRLDMAADTTSATDPVWATRLQTEDGEPILGGAGEYLEEI